LTDIKKNCSLLQEMYKYRWTYGRVWAVGSNMRPSRSLSVLPGLFPRSWSQPNEQQ